MTLSPIHPSHRPLPKKNPARTSPSSAHDLSLSPLSFALYTLFGLIDSCSFLTYRLSKVSAAQWLRLLLPRLRPPRLVSEI